MSTKPAPAPKPLHESVLDLAAALFAEDADTHDALDEYARGRLSGAGLLERLEFLRGIARSRAERRVLGPTFADGDVRVHDGEDEPREGSCA